MTSSSSSVQSLLSGRSVLITGATGFIGKVLVHKLVTSVPQLETIYVLIRSKRSMDARSRFEKLLSKSLFSTLIEDEENRRRLHQLIVPIEGDIGQVDLGLRDVDRLRLIEKVNVIFHVAATVKFNEPIEDAMRINVDGTRNVLELATLMRKRNNLDVFVHVSTAYSQCLSEVIEEKVYNEPNLKEMHKWPNTYTLTKALAENLVAKYNDLPLIIIRPSIVVAARNTPTPGWIDNLNGPTGMMVAAAMGLLRTCHVSGHLRIDVVPVDSLVNLMIVAASQRVLSSMDGEPQSAFNPLVFNFVSSNESPLRWQQIADFGSELIWTYPLEKMLWFPSIHFDSFRLSSRLASIPLHFLPALIIDLVLLVILQKPFLVHSHLRMAKHLASLEFFANRQWQWESGNTHRLREAVSESDHNLFNFDLNNLDWKLYFDHYFYGIRRYALQQSDQSLRKCRMKLRALYFIHCFSKCCILLMAVFISGCVLSSHL